jgi:Icc-related predicted phosphoesterase
MSATPPSDPYLAERIRTAIAQDARVNELGVTVTIVGDRVFVTGTVLTGRTARRHRLGHRRAVPDARAAQRRRRAAGRIAPDAGDHRVIRVAAIGDLHVGDDCAVAAPMAELAHVAEDADVLLLAGDLTKCGAHAEAACLARTIAAVGVPVLGVLGNHDYQSDEAPAVAAVLREAACISSRTAARRRRAWRSRRHRGLEGLRRRLPGACGSDFGEPEMKAFIRTTQALAAKLERDLAGLDADVRIAVLHYSPIPETLQGERLEIYPFLGSYLLAEAIDHAGADLVVHGHAHCGSERGVTPGGVRVRNVALPLIRQPYRVFEFAAGTAPPPARSSRPSASPAGRRPTRRPRPGRTSGRTLRLAVVREVHVDLAALHRAARVADDVLAVVLAGALHADAGAERQDLRIGGDDAFARVRAVGRLALDRIRGRRERHLLALRRRIRDVVGLAARDAAERDGHGRHPGRDAQRADDAAAQEAPHGLFLRLLTSARMLSITWIRSARARAELLPGREPAQAVGHLLEELPVCFIRRRGLVVAGSHADTASSTRPLACASVDWSFAELPRPFAAAI